MASPPPLDDFKKKRLQCGLFYVEPRQYLEQSPPNLRKAQQEPGIGFFSGLEVDTEAETPAIELDEGSSLGFDL